MDGSKVRPNSSAQRGRIGRGDPRTLRALTAALNSTSWRVRREAIDALANLEMQGAIESLEDLYARSSLVPELRAIEAGLAKTAGDG